MRVKKRKTHRTQILITGNRAISNTEQPVDKVVNKGPVQVMISVAPAKISVLNIDLPLVNKVLGVMVHAIKWFYYTVICVLV